MKIIHFAQIQVEHIRRLSCGIKKKNCLLTFNLGTEDVDMGRCFRQLGVYPNKSIDELGRERFHPLSLNAHYHSNVFFFLISLNYFKSFLLKIIRPIGCILTLPIQ